MTVDIFNLTDTWNNGSTVFTSIKVNVTDTASAVGSAFLDFQLGGSTQFKVDKNGNIVFGAGTKTVTGVGNFMLDTTVHFASTSTSNSRVAIASNVDFRSTALLQWSSTAAAMGTKDLGLKREAAGILRITDGSTGDGKLYASDLVLDSLPTTDPTNAGQIWNDSGTLKVSAG